MKRQHRDIHHPFKRFRQIRKDQIKVRQIANLFVLTSIILWQVAAAMMPGKTALAATPLATIDVCAAPSPLIGAVLPDLFLPLVANGGGDVQDVANMLRMRVAFIHGSDTGATQGYQALLSGEGLAVSLLPADAVGAADFSKCDTVIVGADTGQWADAAARAVLLNSHLPLLAQGSGGLNLLEAAGITAGLTRGNGSSADLEPLLRGQDAYNFPHQIVNSAPAANASASAALAIYNATTAVTWLSVATPLPQGIEIGRLPGTSNHPLLQLDGRYVLWGYEGAPEAMTPTGQDLFINLLSFQSSDLQLRLQSRTFVPSAGIDPALLDALATTTLPQIHAYVQYDPAGEVGCPNSATPSAGKVTRIQYLIGTTYIGSIPKGFVSGDLANEPCVRWLGLIPSADKIAPKIVASDFEEWAVTNEGITLLVRFFDEVSDAGAVATLQAHAQSYAKYSSHLYEVVLPQDRIRALSLVDGVRWIEEGPVPQQPLNDITRSLMHVEEVQQGQVSTLGVDYNGLDGSGVVAGVFDVGFDATHPDFAGRVLVVTGGEESHGTHVAGILGGSGANSADQGYGDFQLRGMAPAVNLILDADASGLDDFSTYINTNGMQISNYSMKMSACEGVYDSSVEVMDELVQGVLQDSNAVAIPPHTMIAAAGNEGNSGQYCDETGFHSVFNVGKNMLLVGGVLRDGSNLVADFSSRGPTYDGRLKPDVMAISEARSTLPGGLYGEKSGTSMASPAAAGVGALVVEQYRLSNDGENPKPATVRGLLIHHATDLVNEAGTAGYIPIDNWSDPDTGESLIYYQGPDFSSGYGLVNAARSVEGAASYNALQEELADAAEVDEFSFQVVGGRSEVKVTLVWDDAGGDAALAPSATQLVNDLDLVLIDPSGAMHYPFTLDPLPVNGGFEMDDVEAAYQAEDHRNNVEQVVVRSSDVAAEDWSGTWTARVYATEVPEGPQAYSLIGEWRTIALPDVYPINAGYNEDPDAIVVPVRVTNPHLDPSGAAAYTTPDDWEVYLAQSGEELNPATVQAVWGPVGDQAFLVVRPPDTLAANTPYHLVVFLTNRYQRHQHVLEATQRVAEDVAEDAIIFDDEPRPPVDEMIVGDNSGSMGAHSKLQAAQNAARAFVDRRDVGDQVGVAAFDSGATTLMDLTEVEADESQLAAAKVAVNSMSADGNTAMGLGLLEGKDELDSAGLEGHSRHIVLLSDGLENVAPCWNTEEGHESCIGAESIQPQFVSEDGCPAIQIDTVVIGPDSANWIELLNDIADQSCGQSYIVKTDEDEGGAQAAAVGAEGDGYFAKQLSNNLADVYLDIADSNVRHQRMVDRGGFFFINATAQESFEIEAGLNEVDIVVNWSNAENGVKVSLFRPSGAEVFEADADAHIRRDATHTIYTIQSPAEGTWKIEVGSAAPQEYILSVSAHTPTQLLVSLGLESDQRVPGAQLPIYAVVSDRVGVVKGATVNLRIRIPGGTLVDLPAHDDGEGGDQAAGDGVFTALYTLPARGAYQVKVMAEGTNNDGVAFTRFAQRHLWATERPQAIYVYDTDAASAQGFQNLLEQQGFDVQLVTMAGIAEVDFAAADLTVIGHETGVAPNWGTPEQISHIANNAPRIIGAGQGGHAFFGEVGTAMGSDPGILKGISAVSRWDNSHPVWNTPFDLNGGTPLTIFPGPGGSGIAVNISGEVEAIAGDGVNSTPLWIAREGDRYLLWGFDQGPASMTVEGRTLFGNVAWMMVE